MGKLAPFPRYPSVLLSATSSGSTGPGMSIVLEYIAIWVPAEMDVPRSRTTRVENEFDPERGMRTGAKRRASVKVRAVVVAHSPAHSRELGALPCFFAGERPVALFINVIWRRSRLRPFWRLRKSSVKWWESRKI